MTANHLFTNPVAPEGQIPQIDFEELLEVQSDILGAAASSDENMDELLARLCKTAERLAVDAVASIMLYNESDDRLYVHTAPSIPQEAINALNGLKSGEGSCGNVVYHKTAMYVTNTMTDARWDNLKSFAEAFNIKACWAAPVYNERNEVIGSFALSSFQTREPSRYQRKLLDICASVAGILLRKERYAETRRAWEKEVAKIDKLESVGVLAGGIAHDFNNLLSIVIGNIDMASRKLHDDEKASTYLSSARLGADRAIGLANQLLTFSRGGSPVKTVANLADVLQESANFVLRGSNVKLVFDESCDYPQPCMAYIDTGQIGQVIRNIAINARQAMPDGGVLTIGGERIEADLVPAKLECESSAYYRIDISDTGCGIDESIIDRIYDPYFTTKDEGCGLGLTSAYSIIRNHNGYLSVRSKPGEGSTFSIFVPASDNESSGDDVISTTDVHIEGRVLVVDDEEMIRTIAQTMLEELGMEVLLAEEGSQAIAMYKDAMDADAPFDIVIMDLTIPGGLGGAEAGKRIKELDDGARVIVCSGYSTEALLSSYKDHDFVDALYKPYSYEELSEVVRRVLAA